MLRGRALLAAIAALGALNILGEVRSLDEVIGRTRWLARLDDLGRIR
jgi:hypothetical protein